MVVYSSRRFLAMLIASTLAGLLLVSAGFVILPSYFGQNSNPPFRTSTLANPLIIKAGSDGRFNMTLKGQNGFSGKVDLAAVVSNSENSLYAIPFPSQVTLGRDGTASFALLVNSTENIPAGNYTITLVENSGTVSHIDTITLEIAGFSINLAPRQLSFEAGLNSHSALKVSSVNGYAGSVALTAVTAAPKTSTTLSPNSFYLGPGRTVSSVLTITSSTQGSFDVMITAAGDQFYQSIIIPVTVSGGGDFELSLNPNPLTIVAGTSQNVIINLTSSRGCNCLISLSNNIPTSGIGIGYDLQNLGPLAANGQTNSTALVSVDPVVTPGTYDFTITASSSSVSHSTILKLMVSAIAIPDFSLGLNPASFNLVVGSTINVDVTVDSIAGFTGQVDLTSSISPIPVEGLTRSLNPSRVQVQTSTTVKSTLTISSLTLPSILAYTFTVTGKSGTHVHTVTGSFTVQLTASLPGSLSMSTTSPPASPDRRFS